MRSELPDFKRCCCCLPLRYGLIGWSYVKSIILTLLAIRVIAYIQYNYEAYPKVDNADYKQWILIAMIMDSIFTGITILDIAFSIIFALGGHMKNLTVLRINYFYSIAMLVVYIVYWLTHITLILIEHYEYFLSDSGIGSFITFLCTFFLYIGVQIYVLLLTRSEIEKLRNNCGFRFLNNAAESQCVAITADSAVSERITENP